MSGVPGSQLKILEMLQVLGRWVRVPTEGVTRSQGFARVSSPVFMVLGPAPLTVLGGLEPYTDTLLPEEGLMGEGKS